MKHLLTFGLLSLAAPLAAQASSEVPSIKSVKILQPVSLRREDGKSVTLVQPPEQTVDLSALPAPTKADSTLCDGNFDKTNQAAFLRQIDLFVKVTDAGTKRMSDAPVPLSADEIALLRTVPHCQPFLPFLNLIAENLHPQAKISVIGVGSLSFNASFLQTPKLELSMSDTSTDANDKALFTLPGLRQWGAGQIAASATGQNMSLRIDDLGEDQGSNSGPTEGDQACTVTETRCDRDGNRGCQLVNRPGHQHYVYDPTYFEHSWRLTFANAGGQELMEIEASTQRTQDNGHNDACIPDNDGDWRR